MFASGRRMVLLACAVGVSANSRAACAQATTGPISSQTASAPASAKLPTYDVVTIRPNKQGPGSISIHTNLDVYAATNVSLVNLLNGAYDLRPGMLSGEPSWADSARFDIRGKILDFSAEDLKKLKPEDRQRMLRELLANRFGVQVHRETKVLPVYELVKAKGGSKIQELTDADKETAFRGVSSNGTSIHGDAHKSELIAHWISMSDFASTMSGQLNRTVVDRTGMIGQYDFHLEWARNDAPASDEATLPTLFTAIEEQLGLKLVTGKASVERLVVDHASMPSEEEN